MPVYHPRTRLVNFRLSEEEYLLLKETCARSGARSVSDYARSTVLAQPVLSPPGLPGTDTGMPPDCSERWGRLEDLVLQLASQMNQLVNKGQVTHHG